MQFYTVHLVLFFFSAFLSVVTRRIPSEYLRTCLPGFFFGLLLGSIHLATVGRILLFGILSGAAYFAAVYLAIQTVQFKKGSKKPTSLRGDKSSQPHNRNQDTLESHSRTATPSQTTTMIFNARSTTQLFTDVIAKMLAEEFTFDTKSLALAGALAGFAGSVSLAAAITLVDGTALGRWDYCRIAFTGALAGIVFIFMETSQLWRRSWPPEEVRVGLGYFIWQGSVGIAMVTPLGKGPYQLPQPLRAFYFTEIVDTTRRALGDKWYEFLFGTSAMQNYLSELFGILIALVVIDRVVQYRTERRERPRRDMACVLTFELIDAFIAKYLPAPYKCNGASVCRFGNYDASSGVYTFHEEVLSWSVVTAQIISAERLRWERLNWPDSTGCTEEVRRAEETTLKSVLGDIRQYMVGKLETSCFSIKLSWMRRSCVDSARSGSPLPKRLLAIMNH